MGSSYNMADNVTLTFETDYVTGSSGRVALIGSLPQLGAWEPKRCILAEEQPLNSGHWVARVALPGNTTFLWKWIIISPDRENVHRWEECENRKCTTGTSSGCWEAKWNTPANFHPLTTEKLNTPLKKDCKLKDENKVSDRNLKGDCKLKDDCGVKDDCKPKDGKLNGRNMKEEYTGTPIDDSGVSSQNSKPANISFMEKMRDRLCIII